HRLVAGEAGRLQSGGLEGAVDRHGRAPQLGPADQTAQHPADRVLLLEVSEHGSAVADLRFEPDGPPGENEVSASDLPAMRPRMWPSGVAFPSRMSRGETA